MVGIKIIIILATCFKGVSSFKQPAMQIQTTGKLNILVAVYGLKIVTNKIAALIKEGNPQTLAFKVNNKIIGEDGWQGQKKSISILYNYNGGNLMMATAKEGETLTISNNEFAKSQVMPRLNHQSQQNLSVLGATYGTDDVTYKIKNLISSYNTLSFKADNTIFGDGWYGVAKTLIIFLGHGKKVSFVEMFVERENCYMDLNDLSLANYAELTA